VFGSDHSDDGDEDGFEVVYVEQDWYDGPRAGVANVNGMPHYFRSPYGYGEIDEYLVWPASEAALLLEQEQWAIFVDWNTRREADTAAVASHPGHGGVHPRYDELEQLLAPHRKQPENAIRLNAEWRWSDTTPRYHIGGVDYRVRWSRS